MKDVCIVLRSHGNRSIWTAELVDEENEISMIIGHGSTLQGALNSMLNDTVVSASNMWIEKRNKKNRKPAQTDGYIGIPKRQIS